MAGLAGAVLALSWLSRPRVSGLEGRREARSAASPSLGATCWSALGSGWWSRDGRPVTPLSTQMSTDVFKTERCTRRGSVGLARQAPLSSSREAPASHYYVRSAPRSSHIGDKRGVLRFHGDGPGVRRFSNTMAHARAWLSAHIRSNSTRHKACLFAAATFCCFSPRQDAQRQGRYACRSQGSKYR
ncbi:hypothetical protein B0T14DRAFT_241816 [Immersiella caudata]|uniref:Secreted protein n=1 Tax=Immersiella caudata TaxID=314043 RepID=A0AA40BWC3_9PEZI|nr:hypothetical protein B0T14DRAFT_241816 [Immersiella caudata]